MEGIKIVVIGLGPAGLTALKCLRDEGFSVTAFEKRNEVGGLWSYTDNLNYTSVLKTTVANSGFSDFPLPDEYPPYMSRAQAAEYFQAYAKHFDLEQYVRFNTTVQTVLRSKQNDKWDIHVTGPNGSQVLTFDKVVFGTGGETKADWPPMPGRELFTGTVIHAQSYRSPESFKGKTVLVVGIGNTACEVSLSLRDDASRVYQGYRRGRLLVSRYLDNGVPTDSTLPWPVMRLKYFLDYWIPWLTVPFADRFIAQKMINDVVRAGNTIESNASATTKRKIAEDQVKNQWRLLPAPSMSHRNPAVQEDFTSALSSGHVIPVQGFKEFQGARQVLLSDDSVLEVDAVIFCTGYSLDLSIMPGLEMDGACGMPLKTAQDVFGQENATESEEKHLPRLFQMIFPPRYAESIALLNWMAPQENVWCVSELASMALAQIWSAESAKALNYSFEEVEDLKPAFLPSKEDMNAQVDAYHKWWRGEWQKGQSIQAGYVQAYSFYRFLHDMAGTQLYDHVDHILTGKGWSLWWRDYPLWTWLWKGPMNSYAWRLFESNPHAVPGCGRKTWAGSREAIRNAFENYMKFKQAAEKECGKGK